MFFGFSPFIFPWFLGSDGSGGFRASDKKYAQSREIWSTVQGDMDRIVQINPFQVLIWCESYPDASWNLVYEKAVVPEKPSMSPGYSVQVFGALSHPGYLELPVRQPSHCLRCFKSDGRRGPLQLGGGPDVSGLEAGFSASVKCGSSLPISSSN